MKVLLRKSYEGQFLWVEIMDYLEERYDIDGDEIKSD